MASKRTLGFSSTVFRKKFRAGMTVLSYRDNEVVFCRNPMKKKLGPKQILAVRCPTCGAPPGVRCELNTGQPRTEPHRDRRMIAKD
jgi:hypothetical protein